MKRLLTFFQLAWIREDGDEEARSTMSECLNLLHKNNQDNYIEFIRHYGPALAGIRTWNQNKALKPVSELLTLMKLSSTYVSSTMVTLGRLRIKSR
jgi:hypothetical protein